MYNDSTASLSVDEQLPLTLVSSVCVLIQMGLRETRPLAAISRVQLPSSIFHPASLYSVLSQTILVTALTYGHAIKALKL